MSCHCARHRVDVIPAKAGIQSSVRQLVIAKANGLDPDFRRGDGANL
jgi:hypothetical protein